MDKIKISLYLFWVSVFSFQFFHSGVYSAPIDLQLGARPQALGGAFAALSDDVYAVVWNPAGLTQIKNGEITFMHGLLTGLPGINMNFLGYAQPVGKGGLGVSWLTVMAKLKEGEEERSSQMSESNLTLAYGISPRENLSLGMSIKRLTIESKVGGGAGFGFDFGVLYKVHHKYLILGFIVRNIAADIKNESFPVNYRLGLASRIWKDRIRIVFDVDTKTDIESRRGVSYRIHSGIECEIAKLFALRVGYDVGKITAGLGLFYKGFRLDYAWLLNRILGDTHRLSVTYSFGTSLKK